MFNAFRCLLIFIIISFSKKSYGNTIGVSNSLDPDQTLHLVWPDLGANCLPRLSAYDTSKQRVKDRHGFQKGQLHHWIE